jgi:hypothetical protein
LQVVVEAEQTAVQVVVLVVTEVLSLANPLVEEHRQNHLYQSTWETAI